MSDLIAKNLKNRTGLVVDGAMATELVSKQIVTCGQPRQ